MAEDINDKLSKDMRKAWEEKYKDFAKQIRDSTAWMDGSGYLHAKPKDKEGKSI